MTPEELFDRARAIYVEMRLLGEPVMPPPPDTERVWVDSIDTCEAPDADHREYWVRLVCEPKKGHGLWVLFGKVPHSRTTMSSLARLYWSLANDVSLFNALRPAV